MRLGGKAGEDWGGLREDAEKRTDGTKGTKGTDEAETELIRFTARQEAVSSGEDRK